MTDAPETLSRRSIRRHLFIGLALLALIAGGVGGWAATTEISGAVIAPGILVVDSNVKKVQHPKGGIVGEILARNGDRVAAGDILLRLDATISTANLAIVRKRLTEMTARKARLEAELDGADEITLPKDLSFQSGEPAAAHVISSERKLFRLRRTARIGQQSQLRQRIVQLNEEIRGLTAQASAKSKEIVLIQRELKGTRELWDKNLMPITKLTALEREATRVEGERAQLTASIARANGRIAETELQIIQIDRDFVSGVAKELGEIDAKIGEFVERKVAAEDELKRIDIRAPQAGTVHRSTVHTVGGVINAGEAIMLIVPEADNLTVEARVAPQDIDQLRLKQTAMLRFSAFNQRTTPEINGTLSRISADITTDERSGMSYYTVRIAMAADEVTRLGAVTLVPGMPVEVFVKTGDRKVISYLVKPLSDQITRAFREK
jgi:HlyD family secretion protein